MLCIVTRRTALYTRQEIWFYSGGPVDSSHNDLFYQALVLPDFDVENVRETCTMTIDLTQSESTLLGNIKSGYRAEIRRAPREGASHHVDTRPDKAAIRRYVGSYLHFARAKGLGRIDEQRLTSFSEHDCLCLTTAGIGAEDVTYHSYLLDAGQRTRLLYSHHNLDFARDAVRGHLNKYHHWADMLFFKDAGIRCYDFGGVNFVRTGGIASFKMRFGGILERGYDFQRTRGLYAYLKRRKRPSGRSSPPRDKTRPDA